jgi:23S rRNA (guanosine2251-2'-O)-methyltransferase
MKNKSMRKPFTKNPPRRPPQKSKDRAVIGIHAVKEAIKSSDISTLWLRQGWKDSHELKQLDELAKQHKLKVEERALGELNKIAESHQGVVAFVTSQPEFTWKDDGRQSLIFLDGVEDPHNLGAVMRTAWLLGVGGVFVPDIRAAGLSPAASKVAQGATEHVPLISGSLTESLEEAKERGFWIFGLSHRSPKSIYDLRLPEKVAWVLGSEASGIRKPVERTCDELVTIPQVQSDASFNVSVAAAIALGETFRQHQAVENPGK